jgi:hypothetical protein
VLPFLSLLNAAPAAHADALSLDANMVSAWQRTDLPIVQGKLSRSWLWGPQAAHIQLEDYADAPNGKRLVAYYDKSRMEINNPSGDRTQKWFVTNGLLVKELISGQRQDGDNKFTTLLPADIPVAGDPLDNPGPTYNTFLSVSSINPNTNQATDNTGSTVTATLAKDGSTGNSLILGNNYQIKDAYFEPTLHHNIPQPFWDFMNSTGTIYGNNASCYSSSCQDGSYTTGPVVDWTFSTGYPLSEAYWTRVKVAGVEQDVLVQAFQRRVLTYTPKNSAGYKVEMGNVGQHYYTWRYQTNQIPVCTLNPVSGFGKVWANNPAVEIQLGCPYNAEEGVTTVTYETFERGKMYQMDLSNLNHYYYPLYGYTYPVNKKIILVVFDDGTWATVSDDWTSGMPANGGLTPPAGLYEPQNGIGKAWRDNTALKLRERLGWATAKEVPSGGAIENFYHGNMFYIGGNLKLIYALYSNYGASQTYDVFPDTNTGASSNK